MFNFQFKYLQKAIVQILELEKKDFDLILSQGISLYSPNPLHLYGTEETCQIHSSNNPTLRHILLGVRRWWR